MGNFNVCNGTLVYTRPFFVCVVFVIYWIKLSVCKVLVYLFGCVCCLPMGGV